MRYKVYYRHNDVFANWEAFDVESASERDAEIERMFATCEFKDIRYCKLYADGSEGEFVKVLQKEA